MVALWKDDRPLSALRSMREMFGGVILNAASWAPVRAKRSDRSCIMSICEVHSFITHRFEEKMIGTQNRLAGRLDAL